MDQKCGGAVNCTTPPPANTITILAADLLATRAGQLLDQIACGTWAPAQKLREAIQTYSEVRIDTAMAAGADEILRAIDEKDPQKVNVNDWPQSPETKRSVHHA